MSAGISIVQRTWEGVQRALQNTQTFDLFSDRLEICQDIPDNYFDCVFSISAIKHMPDTRYKDFLLEFLRILKPGGLIS